MGSSACVAELLKAGADPNHTESDGWSALHWAARKGHEQVCELLLQYGAKIDAKDKGCNTPLDWAESRDYTTVATALRNASATHL